MLPFPAQLALVSAVVALFGAFIAVGTANPRPAVGLGLVIAGGLGLALAGWLHRRARHQAEADGGLVEPDEITEIDDARRRELMRGTSLHLRDMRYPYSVRLDPQGGRRAFTAEVNTVRLGFVPAIVTDHADDRQGFGFVAFVHDGRRWRGPGLPCPDGQAEAVAHATKCVQPLGEEEGECRD